MRARQCPVLCVLPLATAFALCAADATPQQLREHGLAALKAAQADEGRIVEAARFLSLAADAYAAAGQDLAAEELNAYLYWAKKKMTLQQMDAFLGTDKPAAEKVIAKLEAVEKKVVKPEDAAAWLARADGFAEGCKDPFLSAVRYFEVASRFKGTAESLEAQRKSLELMQQVKAAPLAVAAPAKQEAAPAKATPKSDGRVYSYNLLAMVNVQRDACRGQWSMNNGALSCTPGDSIPTIRLAMLPATDEYQLRATVKISGSTNCVGLMSIYRGKPANAYTGAGEGRDISNFEMEGLRFDSNPTTVRGRVLQPGQPNEMVLTVKDDVLTLRVNGKLVTSVKPDTQGALRGDQGWPLGKLALGVGAFGGGTVTFQSIQLICSGAQAKPNVEP